MLFGSVCNKDSTRCLVLSVTRTVHAVWFCLIGTVHAVWLPVMWLRVTGAVCVQVSQSGMLMLSEEERRTLVSEGYPIPQKLPLTKQEEKNLKKIRRKIKNKVSTGSVTGYRCG